MVRGERVVRRDKRSGRAEGRRMSRCLSLGLLVMCSAAGPASAREDVNCNGIDRQKERDPDPNRLRPDCMDYFRNGNKCSGSEVPPERPCDDYKAPGPGKAATCGPQLAPDQDGDLLGDSCDNCPDVP